MSNLLEDLKDWTIYLTNKQLTNVAYFNFSKAFDTVSHVKLFEMLKFVGLTGNLLKWLMDFLSGHMQRTRVDAAYCEAIAMAESIVQGHCISVPFYS